MNSKITALFFLLCCCMAVRVHATVEKQDSALIKRVFAFGRNTRDFVSDSADVYTKYYIKIDRRNLLLGTAPTLYHLLRDGGRLFFGESYGTVFFKKNHDVHFVPKIRTSTIYHNHQVFDVVNTYFTPRVYTETLFDNRVLSPFNRFNAHFYIYKTVSYSSDSAVIVAKPRIKNTQLVQARAVIDVKTGQIRSFNLDGEYDMLKFSIHGQLQHDGMFAIVPQTGQVSFKFSYLGNKINARWNTVYTPCRHNNILSGQIPHNPVAAMKQLRPIPLEEREQAVIDSLLATERSDTADSKTVRKIKKVIFKDLGANIFEHMKADIGIDSVRKAQLRLGPVFNPLYFGYTHTKGISYHFDLQGRYFFNDNNNMNLRAKIGYSFKLKEIYFRIPLTWNYDIRHNGYAGLTFRNGNRITNSMVLDAIRDERADSIDWEKLDLDYFKDTNLRFFTGHDIIHDRILLETGIAIHHRSAVNKKQLAALGRPVHYTSFAPFVTIQYTPSGSKGPVLTAQYERSFKDIGHSNTRYERWEFDEQYMYDIPCMRALKIRSGIGFYTNRSSGNYFLDYYNFHENYISGGWNDDWSGEFSLLPSQWYNASKYYVRGNLTYESPLLFLSFMPLAGQVIEKERVYFNILAVQKLWPYCEVGYSFTNRVFSAGFFIGFSNHKFEGAGLKFGLELFNNW